MYKHICRRECDYHFVWTCEVRHSLKGGQSAKILQCWPSSDLANRQKPPLGGPWWSVGLCDQRCSLTFLKTRTHIVVAKNGGCRGSLRRTEGVGTSWHTVGCHTGTPWHTVCEKPAGSESVSPVFSFAPHIWRVISFFLLLFRSFLLSWVSKTQPNHMADTQLST